MKSKPLIFNFLFASIAYIIAVVSNPVAAEALEFEQKVIVPIIADQLNIYEEKTNASKIVGTVKYGEYVEVEAIDFGMARIDFGTAPRGGWIDTAYFNPCSIGYLELNPHLEMSRMKYPDCQKYLDNIQEEILSFMSGYWSAHETDQNELEYFKGNIRYPLGLKFSEGCDAQSTGYGFMKEELDFTKDNEWINHLKQISRPLFTPFQSCHHILPCNQSAIDCNSISSSNIDTEDMGKYLAEYDGQGIICGIDIDTIPMEFTYIVFEISDFTHSSYKYHFTKPVDSWLLDGVISKTCEW